MKLLPRMNYGEDVRIHDSSVIKRPELNHIGNHVLIDGFCWITARLNLGDFIHIANHCSIIGGKESILKMGHFTTLAAGCRIICCSDEHMGAGLVSPVIPAEYRDNLLGWHVTLEDFASLATGVTVYPDVVLGAGSFVLAGAVVAEDTEPWTVYRGIPAKPYKKRPKEKMLEYARALGYDY